MNWQNYGDHKPERMNKHNFLWLSPEGKTLILTIADFKIIEHSPYGSDHTEKRIALLFHEADACPYVLTNERCALLEKLTKSSDPKGWIGSTIGLELLSKNSKSYPELQNKLYPPKRTDLDRRNGQLALEKYQKDGHHYWLNYYFLVSKSIMEKIEKKVKEITMAEFYTEEEKAQQKKTQTSKKASTPKAPSTKKLLSKDNERHMAVIDAKFQQLGKEERYTYDDLIGPMEDYYEMDDATRIEVQELAAKWGYPSNLVRK